MSNKRLKKLKHNKIKNTGIIWELLVRQLTTDIVNNNRSKVKQIIKEYFNKNTEIYKEHRIYQVLLNTKMKNSTSAHSLIKEMMESTENIDVRKLKQEKYNLIKELKEEYNIDKFFKSNIPNYKDYATIYKLLVVNEENNIKTKAGQISMLKENLTNCILKDKNNNNTNKLKQMIKEKTDRNYVDNKMIFKIMVENFNKKYSNLNKNQRDILKLFIERPINSIKLRNKISESIKKSLYSIKETYNNINDKAMKIKLNHVLNKMKNNKQKVDNGIMHDSIITSTLLFEAIKDEVNKL